jgi:hypothetical protein
MRTLIMLIFSFVALSGIAAAQRGDTLTAEEIVQRTIARRAEIRTATTSFTASLHSRSLVEIRASNFIASALLPTQEVADESFGTYYRDQEGKSHIRVTAHRGTLLKSGMSRNMIENFQSLGRVIGVDNDRIVLLNTSLVSPLADDALQYYSYQRVRQIDHDGVPVYELSIHPATTLYPAFTGTMMIARKTFDVVSLTLSASEETAIPFVRSLTLVERFSPVENGLYQPASFELNAEGKIAMLGFGMAESEASVAITSTFDDRRINAPLPDSMRTQTEPLVVAKNARSMPPEFWREQRSMLNQDQIVKVEESQRNNRPRPITTSIAPYLDYNRAGGMSVGMSGTVTYGRFAINSMLGYSFALERAIDEGTFSVTLGPEEGVHGTARVRLFSGIATTTVNDQSYPRVMNSLVAATLHQDYYNFMRKVAWGFGGDIAYDQLRLTAAFEDSRQSSLVNSSRWALLTWKTKEFQPNPMITDGDYQTVQADLVWGRVTPFLKITPVGAVDLRWSLTGLLGRRTDSSSSFRLAEALMSVSVPVVQTGYNPMTLTLLGAAGAGTESLPPQYQFRLRTSAASFGKPGGFVSPPKGLYGGTEYLALGMEFNTTDLWWRAMGLPTYNGRGVELILAGGSTRYLQRHPTGYIGTGDLWYSEAGIALSRIPLFLTDIVSGRVDLRYGLGPLGKFGANFTLVLPM